MERREVNEVCGVEGESRGYCCGCDRGTKQEDIAMGGTENQTEGYCCGRNRGINKRTLLWVGQRENQEDTAIDSTDE